MPSVATADERENDLGPRCQDGALKLVLTVLPKLTALDTRYLVWDSRRKICGHANLKSPGTVGTHNKSLLAVGVLVPGDRDGKYLLDTHRLAELRPVGDSATGRLSSGTATAAAVAVREDRPPIDETATATAEQADDITRHLLAAVDNLTSVAELEPNHLGTLAPMVARLSGLMVSNRSQAKVLSMAEARNRAQSRDGLARNRATIARSEERKKDQTIPNNQVEQGLSVSLSETSIARSRATLAEVRDSRDRSGSVGRATDRAESAPKRSLARLLELTAPFNPDGKLPYDALGILENVEDYSDETIAYAAELVSIQPGVEEPFAYFRALARKGDPTFFPATPPPLDLGEQCGEEEPSPVPPCTCGAGGWLTVGDAATSNTVVPCGCGLTTRLLDANDRMEAVQIGYELAVDHLRDLDTSNPEMAAYELARRLGAVPRW